MHWSLQRSNITRTHCLIYSAVLIQLQISNRSRGLIVHKNRLKANTRGGHQTEWMPGLSEVIEKGVTEFDRFPPRESWGAQQIIHVLWPKGSWNMKFFENWKVVLIGCQWKVTKIAFFFSSSWALSGRSTLRAFSAFWCISKPIDATQHHMESKQTVKREWKICSGGVPEHSAGNLYFVRWSFVRGCRSAI